MDRQVSNSKIMLMKYFEIYIHNYAELESKLVQIFDDESKAFELFNHLKFLSQSKNDVGIEIIESEYENESDALPTRSKTLELFNSPVKQGIPT